MKKWAVTFGFEKLKWQEEGKKMKKIRNEYDNNKIEESI